MIPQGDRLVRFAWTDHLAELVGRTEAAAARVATAPPAARAAEATAAQPAVARLSLLLDASPLTVETAAAVDARLARGLAPLDDAAAARAGAQAGADVADFSGWARALRLDAMATQEVATLEYAGMRALVAAEADLAPRFLEAPVATLRAAHTLACAGLVDAEVRGRTRRTDQAVLDGGQGKVLYHLVDPGRLPGLLAAFDRWVTTASATMPALVVAGAVHGLLLAWGPFEAANGRIARTAARLVLRARGTDPAGLGVTERFLAADRFGYYAEVAATLRRRGDLALWLERVGEATAEALEDVADRLVPPVERPEPPERARAVLAVIAPGDALTLRDYALRAGVSLATARVELAALRAAGLVRVEPHSRGLRVRRPEATGVTTAGRPA